MELFDSTAEMDVVTNDYQNEKQGKQVHNRKQSSFLYSVGGSSVVDDDSKVLYN